MSEIKHLEYKLKEAKARQGLLKKVEIQYLSGKYGPTLDNEGKVIKEGMKDTVLASRAKRLKDLGKVKILTILMLLAFGLSMGAQDFTIYKVGAPTQIVTTDTIDDTGTDNVTVLLRVPDESGWHANVMVTAINKTGTTDIDCNFQGSMDNSSWFTIESDSLAAGNLSFIFEDEDGFPARYFRLLYTGVGTQKSTVDAWIYVLKQAGN